MIKRVPCFRGSGFTNRVVSNFEKVILGCPLHPFLNQRLDPVVLIACDEKVRPVVLWIGAERCWANVDGCFMSLVLRHGATNPTLGDVSI